MTYLPCRSNQCTVTSVRLFVFACFICAGADETAGSTDSDANIAVLSAFKAVFVNFDLVATERGWTGWVATSRAPTCQWTGVTCDSLGRVITLQLEHAGLAGTLPWDLGTHLSSVRHLQLGNNAIGGKLQAAWDQFGWGSLQSLTLENNLLEGSLPGNWGSSHLSSVTSLDLSGNALTGSLPDAWAVLNRWPNLTHLSLAGNRFSGRLPKQWGMAGLASFGGFTKLNLLNMSGCNLQGQLGSNWAAVLPLQTVDLSRNKLHGSLPDTLWPTLMSLDLSGNAFEGQLPELWGAEGNWQDLQSLSLADNLLAGVLPGTWGAGGSMLHLQQLMLQGNGFNGSIPAVWQHRFGPLQRLVLLRNGSSNEGMCGAVPSGIHVFDANNTGPIRQLPGGRCTEQPSGGDSSKFHLTKDIIAVVLMVLSVLLALHITRRLVRAARKRRGAYSYLPITFHSSKAGDGRAGGRRGDRRGGGRRGGKGGSQGGRKDGTSSESSDGQSTSEEELGHQPAHQMQDSAKALLQFAHPKGSALSAPMSTAATSSVPSSCRSSREAEGRQLADVADQDWLIDPAHIHICKRPDGRPWKLGSGTFGTVFKAVQDDVAEVAVKVFKVESEATAEQLQAVRQEIDIIRGCRHANIVQFCGACLDRDNLMMVTELMQCDLHTAFTRPDRAPQLSWYRQGRSVVLDIAKGLHHLHQSPRAVVHFDLKSPNILLHADNHAKIADVGLSKLLSSATHVSNTSMRGTFDWAAPEIITGERCTTAVDIFSLGVCIWEVCTHERPSRGRNRSIRVPEEAPPEVEKLMQWCNHWDPTERPTAKQVVHYIQAMPAEPSHQRGQ